MQLCHLINVNSYNVHYLSCYKIDSEDMSKVSCECWFVAEYVHASAQRTVAYVRTRASSAVATYAGCAWPIWMYVKMIWKRNEFADSLTYYFLTRARWDRMRSSKFRSALKSSSLGWPRQEMNYTKVLYHPKKVLYHLKKNYVRLGFDGRNYTWSRDGVSTNHMARTFSWGI